MKGKQSSLQHSIHKPRLSACGWHAWQREPGWSSQHGAKRTHKKGCHPTVSIRVPFALQANALPIELGQLMLTGKENFAQTD